MTKDDWAAVYLAWMNGLPLSDAVRRWESLKKTAAQNGHCGSCVKEPGSCPLCIQEECLEGGRRMAEVWAAGAVHEGPDP